MKTIRAKQAEVHFAYFVHYDQHVIIAKHLTSRKVIFECDVFVAAVVTPQ